MLNKLSIFKQNIITTLLDKFKLYSNNSTLTNIQLIDKGCFINNKNKVVCKHIVIFNEHYIFTIIDLSTIYVGLSEDNI